MLVRTFVIGDIHGCFDELIELLVTIDLDWDNDKLVLIGDYIDRGNKSYETVKSIQALQQKHGRAKVVALAGNHEQMAVDYYETGNERWFRNGAEATITSFEQHGEQVEDWLDFFKSLSYYHEDANFIYVHAGIQPEVPMEKQSEQDLIWIRNEFFEHPHANEKTVVFGHTPTQALDGGSNPVHLNGNIAVDTGCVYGGTLTAIELVDGKMVQLHQVQSMVRKCD